MPTLGTPESDAIRKLPGIQPNGRRDLQRDVLLAPPVVQEKDDENETPELKIDKRFEAAFWPEGSDALISAIEDIGFRLSFHGANARSRRSALDLTGTGILLIFRPSEFSFYLQESVPGGAHLSAKRLTERWSLAPNDRERSIRAAIQYLKMLQENQSRLRRKVARAQKILAYLRGDPWR